MKKVLVLGGSYLQSHFISTAIRHSCEVYIADANEECYAAKKSLGNFIHLDFADIEAVTLFCVRKKINSVIAPVNEFGNLIASIVSEKLNFQYNPVEVVRRSSDKSLIWEKLKSVAIPKGKSYSENELNKISYPVIVKPTVSTSSKGASLVRDQLSLGKAILYAKENGKTSEIRIEEYIEGNQFSLETITFNGKHYVIGIIQEHLSNEPHFFERTDILTLSVQDEYKSFFVKFINLLLTELGVVHGPCHIEVRVKGNEIYLIDFATRSGGWRDIMLYYAGIKYNELILKSYLEKDFVFDPVNYAAKYSVGAGILMYSSDQKNLKIARESNFLCEFHLLDKKPAAEPRSLADAYGYYFLKASSTEKFKGLLPVI